MLSKLKVITCYYNVYAFNQQYLAGNNISIISSIVTMLK